MSQDRDAGIAAAARATPYSWYVLGVLTLVYLSNNIDRQILAVLIKDIKAEFGVSDTQIGLLAGPAFAIFYTLLGLPIARWADQGNRRSIIALGISVWSAMTALSGMVQSFAQLTLARIGVAVGEAAGTPPAHSLISDYFPPSSRGRALGIYASGQYLAGPIGVIGGAWVAAEYGWRAAFLVFGIPGLLLGLLVRGTVREPVRGRMDAMPSAPRPASREALRALFARRSYFHVLLGGSLHALSVYGLIIWIYVFMERVHGVSMKEASVYIGLLSLLFGLLGVALGGWLIDRLSPKDVRWFLWLPSLQAVIGAPFILLFLYLDRLDLALASYVIYWVLSAGYNAPVYALIQSLAGASSRALAVATYLFVVNLIGLTIGPLLIGFLNDELRAVFGEQGIRYSMMVAGLANVVAVVFYMAGARTVRQDVTASS